MLCRSPHAMPAQRKGLPVPCTPQCGGWDACPPSPCLSSVPYLGGASPPSCRTTDGAWPQPGHVARATCLCQQLWLPPLRLHHPLWQGLSTGRGGPGWAPAFPVKPHGGGWRAEGCPGTRGQGWPWAPCRWWQGAGGGEPWRGEACQPPSQYVLLSAGDLCAPGHGRAQG